MPEMHLKQPGFTYRACRPFTKNKERTQKFKETGDMSYIYKKEFDKACCQHDIAYGDLKRRTFSDKEKKRTACSGFKDNIWGVDLGDMQWLSKYNKGIKYLLGAIDFFSKYVWVVPIKDKKGVSIVDAFQKILKESNWSKAKSKGETKQNMGWQRKWILQ